MVRRKKNGQRTIISALLVITLFSFFSPFFVCFPLSSANSADIPLKWDVPANQYKPPIPTNLSYTYGNFYINFTWEAGDTADGYAETDSYNLSYWVNTNHYWDNSTNISLNRTVGAHGWLNISELWAYNNSYTNLSNGYIYQSVQLPNNPISITNTSGWSGNEGEMVYLDFDYTDLDSDMGTFTTNATKGSLNSSTGVFEWQTTTADDGVYYWRFNVSDGYGSSDSYTTTITVNDLGKQINLTSWYNNYTCDNSTDFTIPYEDADNRTVFFNVTAEQNMDYWVWDVDFAPYQNSSSNNITKTWDKGGDKRVSVYGVNANGKTQTLYWYITIEYTEYEIEWLKLQAMEAQVEAEEMLGQTWLFLVLLLLAFVFLAAGYLAPNGTLKIFGAAFSSLLFFILAYAIIGNQFGDNLQMGWLATLLGALGIVQAIYTLLAVISVLYMLFVSRRQAGMDSIPFDPADRNW